MLIAINNARTTRPCINCDSYKVLSKQSKQQLSLQTYFTLLQNFLQQKFKYLGFAFTSDRRQDDELDIQNVKASAVIGALKYLVVMKRELSKKSKLSIFKIVFVPILTRGIFRGGIGPCLPPPLLWNLGEKSGQNKNELNLTEYLFYLFIYLFIYFGLHLHQFGIRIFCSCFYLPFQIPGYAPAPPFRKSCVRY